MLRTQAPIDCANPVNWNYSFNQGLMGWWLGVPGLRNGQYFYNLKDLPSQAKTGLHAQFNSNTLNPILWSGDSLKFAGSGAGPTCTTINKVSLPSTGFSCFAWVNTASSATQYVLSLDDNSTSALEFSVSGTSVIRARIVQTRNTIYIGRTTGNIVTINTWLYVGMTWDGATGIKIYLNGYQVDTTNDNLGSFTAANTTPLNLGLGCLNANTNQFNGYIKDIRAYNYGLSANQSETLYQESASNYPNALNRITRYIFGGKPLIEGSDNAILTENQQTNFSSTDSSTLSEAYQLSPLATDSGMLLTESVTQNNQQNDSLTLSDDQSTSFSGTDSYILSEDSFISSGSTTFVTASDSYSFSESSLLLLMDTDSVSFTESPCPCPIDSDPLLLSESFYTNVINTDIFTQSDFVTINASTFKTATDTTTLTEASLVIGAKSRSVSQTISFTQTVVNNQKIPTPVLHSIIFTDSIYNQRQSLSHQLIFTDLVRHNHPTQSLVDTINLTDIVQGHNAIIHINIIDTIHFTDLEIKEPRAFFYTQSLLLSHQLVVHTTINTITQTLTFSDSVHVSGGEYPFTLSHDLIFRDGLVLGQTLHFSVSDLIPFEQVVNDNPIFRSLIDTLSLTDNNEWATRSGNISQNLSLTDTLTIYHGTGFVDTLNLTHNLKIGLIVTYRLTDILSLNQVVNVLVYAATPGSDNSNTSTQVYVRYDRTYQSSSPLPPYITLSGIGSINLFLPDFGNTDAIEAQRIYRKAQGGKITVFKDPSWPTRRRKTFSFSYLNQSDLDSILSFFNSNAGLQVSVTDPDGVSFSGIIIDPENIVSEKARYNYSASFTVEGVI